MVYGLVYGMVCGMVYSMVYGMVYGQLLKLSLRVPQLLRWNWWHHLWAVTSSNSWTTYLVASHRESKGPRMSLIQLLPNAAKCWQICKCTDRSIVSALTTFGKYSGLPSIHRKTSAAANNQHGIQIGVQPTSVGRRRQTLSGKRKQVAGRPPGSTQIQSHMVGHAYTTFVLLPSRKREAPHNIQQCVYSSVGFRCKKQSQQLLTLSAVRIKLLGMCMIHAWMLASNAEYCVELLAVWTFEWYIRCRVIVLLVMDSVLT